jgi:hypothetical protein
MKKIIALSFALLCSCGQDEPLPFVLPHFLYDKECGTIYEKQLPLEIGLPDDADPNYDALLDYSISWWNNEIPDLVKRGNEIIIEINDIPVEMIDFAGEMNYKINIYSCAMLHVKIIMNFTHPGLDQDHQNATILIHEIGHALGLKHDYDNENSIMAPFAKRNNPPILLPETKEEMIFLYKKQ